MFTNTEAFSGFAVDDLEAAKKFYGETLGIRTSSPRDQAALRVDARAQVVPDRGGYVLGR